MLRLLHRPFEQLAPQLGASADELKLIVSFLLSYPFAGILKRLPDNAPHKKNAFIMAVSCFYLVCLFDMWDGIATIAISSVGTYLIAKYLRHSSLMPWIGFAFVMTHMSISHIYRQVADSPSSVDITGAQMVLVMKLSAFCWNVADGLLPDDQLSDFQKDRRLKELPSVLSFAGYVLFFPSLFAGPAFDYAEYSRWIDTSMFNVPDQVEAAKRPPVRKKRKIPRSGTPAAWKAVSGLLWLGAFIYLSRYYYPALLTSDSYMEYGFLRRVLALYLTGMTARLKYYAVWALAEGACILTGLGYNGVDPVTGKVSWNRLQNINPIAVETAQNIRGYLAGWNMNTNNWLRNYVYLRVTPRGRKPGFRASLITFTTSALWHGFYPGYYMAFILASIVQTSAKNIRRYIRPFFLDPATNTPTSSKKYYDILCFVVTQLTLSFVVAPFLILRFSGSVLVWSRVYYYGLAGNVVLEMLFHSPAKHQLRHWLEQRSGRPRRVLPPRRSESQDSISSSREPMLGVSSDLQQDLTDAVEELKAEALEMQQRDESKVKKAK